MTKKLTLALNSRDGTKSADVKEIGKVWKKSLQQGVIDPSYGYYKGVLALLYCDDDFTNMLSRVMPGYTFITIEGVDFGVLISWLAQKSFPRRFSLTYLDTYVGDSASTTLRSMITIYFGSNDFDTERAIAHHDRTINQLRDIAAPESDPVIVSLLSPEFRSDLSKYTGVTENVATEGALSASRSSGTVSVVQPKVTPTLVVTPPPKMEIANNLGVRVADRGKAAVTNDSDVRRNVDSITATRPQKESAVSMDKSIPVLSADGLASTTDSSSVVDNVAATRKNKKDSDWSGFITVGTILTSIVTGVIANEIQDRKNDRKKAANQRDEATSNRVDPGFDIGRRRNPFVRYFPNGYKILG